uniref:Uncharacterized protein n=1 Tax=Rhizophagus irregularis (strain DAOM 181602 / DAOM 197198 / MUCL 43194) TaxID=747089 RepID=U9V2G2_RHIID
MGINADFHIGKTEILYFSTHKMCKSFERDEYIQQLRNERTNEHLALRHQLSVLREDLYEEHAKSSQDAIQESQTQLKESLQKSNMSLNSMLNENKSKTNEKGMYD